MGEQRDTAELPVLLAEQIGFLKVSARAFDAGMEAEGKRIAVVLRTLLKDTASSTSLLKQTGHKQGLFIDSAEDRPANNQLRMPNLVRLQIPLGRRQHARLVPNAYKPDRPALRLIGFDEWWTAPVMAGPGGKTFTRGDLIQLVAEKDGGAHVDPKLPEAYSKWTRAGEFCIPYGPPENGMMLSNVHLASLRQMAHEILLMLEPGYALEPQPMVEAVELSSVTVSPSEKGLAKHTP